MIEYFKNKLKPFILYKSNFYKKLSDEHDDELSVYSLGIVLYVFFFKNLLILSTITLIPPVFTYHLLNLFFKDSRNNFVIAPLNSDKISAILKKDDLEENLLYKAVVKFPNLFGFFASNTYCAIILKSLEEKNDVLLNKLLNGDECKKLKNIINWALKDKSVVSSRRDNIYDNAYKLVYPFDLIMKNFEKYAVNGFFKDISLDFYPDTLAPNIYLYESQYIVNGYNVIYGGLSSLLSEYGESFGNGLVKSKDLKEISEYLISHIDKYSRHELNKYNVSGGDDFRERENKLDRPEFTDFLLKVCIKNLPALEKEILLESLNSNNYNLACNASALGVDLNQKIAENKTLLELSLSKNKSVLSRYLVCLGCDLNGKAVRARKSNLEKIKKIFPENKIKNYDKLRTKLDRADLENIVDKKNEHKIDNLTESINLKKKRL